MKLFAFSAVTVLAASAAAHGYMVSFSDPSGLAAEAEFTLIDAMTLQIRVRNTSTGVPGGFDSSDQILTGISFDFGLPGDDPGDVMITGGSVIIGPTSASVNFDSGVYGAGDDVSGEYGYGNNGTTNMFPNMLTGNQAGATPFGGLNLDGPVSLSGPQGGLIADPMLVDLGGLGAIQNEIIATLTLSGPLSDLSFLQDNLVRVEFGSDAAFLTIPAPGSAALLGFGALLRRRRG